MGGGIESTCCGLDPGRWVELSEGESLLSGLKSGLFPCGIFTGTSDIYSVAWSFLRKYHFVLLKHYATWPGMPLPGLERIFAFCIRGFNVK